MSAIEYIGTISDRYKSILERFLTTSKINIIHDIRIMPASKEESEKDETKIYSIAVFNGYKKDTAKYIKEKSILLDGKNIFLDETEKELLTCVPVNNKNIVTVVDDHENYLAQRYGNIIVLACDINTLNYESIRSIFTYLGLKEMDEREFLEKKMEKLALMFFERKYKDAEANMGVMEKQMKGAYDMWRGYYDNYLTSKMIIEGGTTIASRVREDLYKQIDKVLKCPDIDTIEIVNNTVSVLTKPLKIAIWDIGQYKITYNMKDGTPRIERLVPPTGEDVIMCQGTVLPRNYSTAYVGKTNDRYCSGNWERELQEYWKGNILKGINNTIKYIKSFYHEGGPPLPFNEWLRMEGYINDADKIGMIYTIDDGVVIKPKLSEEKLREMGCTGVRDPPEAVKKWWVEHSRIPSSSAKEIAEWEILEADK